MNKKLRCPECGTPLKPGETTCPVCNKAVSEDTSVAQPQGDLPEGITPAPEAGATDTQGPIVMTKPDKKALKEQKAQEQKARKEQEAREKHARKEAEAKAKQQKKEQEAREKQARSKAKTEKNNGKNPNTLPYVLICILGALLVGACIWFFIFYTGKSSGSGGGGGGSSSDGDKKTEKTDSAANDSTAAGNPEAQAPKPIDPNLMTPDLAFNELHGPVEYMRKGEDYGYGTSFYGGEFFYSPDGEWINIPRWKEGESSHFQSTPAKYTKDASGNIVSINDWSGNQGSTTRTNIMWENSRIKSKNESQNSNSYEYYYSGNTNWDYTYDDKGLPTRVDKTSNYSSSYGESTNNTTTMFSYIEFDEYGNWTKRNVNERITSSDGSSYNNNYMEVRQIFYYK